MNTITNETSKRVSDLSNPRCACGEKATYVCECGCLCCGEDPCEYGCGGAVKPIGDHNPSLTVRHTY